MTIALNQLSQVALHPCTVGAEPAILPLKVAKASGGAMGARAKIADTHVEGKTIEVPIKTLDELIGADRPIFLLQLDIEGHETPALEGARNIVTTHAPVIILEAPKPWQQRDYADTLARLFPEQQYRLCGAIERNAFFHPLKQTSARA